MIGPRLPGDRRHGGDRGGEVPAFDAWLGVHAQLLSNAGAEKITAFLAWADDFYLRRIHPAPRNSSIATRSMRDASTERRVSPAA